MFVAAMFMTHDEGDDGQWSSFSRINKALKEREDGSVATSRYSIIQNSYEGLAVINYLPLVATTSSKQNLIGGIPTMGQTLFGMLHCLKPMIMKPSEIKI